MSWSLFFDGMTSEYPSHIVPSAACDSEGSESCAVDVACNGGSQPAPLYCCCQTLERQTQLRSEPQATRSPPSLVPMADGCTSVPFHCVSRDAPDDQEVPSNIL